MVGASDGAHGVAAALESVALPAPVRIRLGTQYPHSFNGLGEKKKPDA